MIDLEPRLKRAIREFWLTRSRQQNKQKKQGKRDQGSRGSVTGGGQMDGVIDLVTAVLTDAGVPREAIYRGKTRVDIPGYYRPSKSWDLLVVMDDRLLAVLEFKSHVGSFGNNYNNRTEEALGNATDLWEAFKKDVYPLMDRPWVGYFMLLEEAPGSTSPVVVREPHFKVLPEFVGASYARRYELLCEKLVRERLYDAACLILSGRAEGMNGVYHEPVEQLGFSTFITSLRAKLLGYLATRRSP